MVGFDVTPRIPASTRRCSSPLRKYARFKLSSHGLWPCVSKSCWSFVIPSSPMPEYLPVFEEDERCRETVYEVAAADGSELACREEAGERHGPEQIPDDPSVVIGLRKQI